MQTAVQKTFILLSFTALMFSGCSDPTNLPKATLKSETIPQIESIVLDSPTINIDRARGEAPATIQTTLNVKAGKGVRERAHMVIQSVTLYAGDQVQALEDVENEKEVDPPIADIPKAMASLKFENKNSRYVDETTLAFSSDNFTDTIINHMTTNGPLDVLCDSDTVTLQITFDTFYISFADQDNKIVTIKSAVAMPLQCAN